MSYDIDEAIDWRGEAVDCASLRASGLDASGHVPAWRTPASMIAMRGGSIGSSTGIRRSPTAMSTIRISRCARSPPNTPTVFLLPPLLDDPEETVRWNAARRLPKRYDHELRHDPHREVRIRVVPLLEDADLVPMMEDPDYYVRLVICAADRLQSCS